MGDIVEDLRGRARGYRIGGPSSAHTAVMLEDAADEIERLRAALLAWDDAVKIYPTMEGPRYGGMSSELAKKAWVLTNAALDGQPALGKEEA